MQPTSNTASWQLVGSADPLCMDTRANGRPNGRAIGRVDGRAVGRTPRSAECVGCQCVWTSKLSKNFGVARQSSGRAQTAEAVRSKFEWTNEVFNGRVFEQSTEPSVRWAEQRMDRLFELWNLADL